MSSRDTVDPWACRYKQWYYLNKATGEIIEYDCKMWSCIQHQGKVWFRWMKRTSHIPWTLMITLTHVPRDPTQERIAWGKMRRYLTRTGVRTFLKVTEFGQRTEMKHYHIAVEPITYLSVYALSVAAGQAGMGIIVYVSTDKLGRSPLDAVTYLLKYCFKDYTNTRLPKGFRRVTCSRNVPSWPNVCKSLGLKIDVDESDEWFLVKGVRGKGVVVNPQMPRGWSETTDHGEKVA